MKIKINNSSEHINELTSPIPWYFKSAFDNQILDIEQVIHKDSITYCQLSNTSFNHSVFTSLYRYLTERMKDRVRNKKLNMVYIPMAFVEPVEKFKNIHLKTLLVNQESQL